MPWDLPEDLARFKKLTMGRPIIMGRKTFDSIGRVLPGRHNIVITRNPDWSHPGVSVTGSLANALELASLGESGPVFVIGGGEIFKEAMPLASRLELTLIGESYGCDTFFPAIDKAAWPTAHMNPTGRGHTFITLTRESRAKVADASVGCTMGF